MADVLGDANVNLIDAAKWLGIHPKTLRRHVDHGDLPYIALGLGRKKRLFNFDPADLRAFRNKQRRAEPCPSSSGEPSTISPSRSTVIDFAGRARPQIGGMPYRMRKPRGKKPRS